MRGNHTARVYGAIAAAILGWSAPVIASPEGAGLRDAANPPNEVTLRALDPTVPTDLHEIRRATVEIGGGVQAITERDDGDCLDLCLTYGVDVYAVVPIASRIALVSRIWGRSLLDGADSVTYGMSTAGARYTIIRGLWVGAGLGIARATIDRDEDLDVAMGYAAPAAEASAGLDLMQIGSVELGVETRAGANLYDPGVPIYAWDLTLAAHW